MIETAAQSRGREREEGGDRMGVRSAAADRRCCTQSFQGGIHGHMQVPTSCRMSPGEGGGALLHWELEALRESFLEEVTFKPSVEG